MSQTVVRRLFSRGIGRMGSQGNQIYLTYDDGPHPEVTPRLLEILKEADAKATFFVVASTEPWWGDLIRRIASEGHGLGLHGLSHRSNFLRRNRNLSDDLSRLAEMITKAGAQCANLYRPPYGHVRPDTVRHLHKRGMETVLWSSIPGDYRPVQAQTLLVRALRDLTPGAIYALHDGVSFTPAPVLELTRSLLDEIHRRGWHTASLR
jgi:peptidoglycan/xylan/chitin deacetylase (PgdA/CDA1 family)